MSSGITCGCACPGAGIYASGSGSSAPASGSSGFLVLQIPDRGPFVRPFDVAGDGARYFLTTLDFINGNPSSWSFSIALINFSIG